MGTVSSVILGKAYLIQKRGDSPVIHELFQSGDAEHLSHPSEATLV